VTSTTDVSHPTAMFNTAVVVFGCVIGSSTADFPPILPTDPMLIHRACPDPQVVTESQQRRMLGEYLNKAGLEPDRIVESDDGDTYAYFFTDGAKRAAFLCVDEDLDVVLGLEDREDDTESIVDVDPENIKDIGERVRAFLRDRS
jgi:hypothetical protein